MKSEKTICHLQKITGVGGSEQFLVQLGEGLSDRGWDCRIGVITESNKPVENMFKRLSDHGWQTKRFVSDHRISPSLIYEIRKWIQSNQPGILHTHLIHGDLYGALASYGFDMVKITSKHNDDRFKHTPGYGFFSRMLNAQFDQGIAISDHIESFYRDELGVTIPFERIHYGLDTDEFMQSADTNSINESIKTLAKENILFGIVARLVDQKGHPELLEAFAKVNSRFPDTHLLIIGGGPNEGELKKLTRELNLSDSVSYLGVRHDVPSLLQQMDVFVHPSRWEGFGLVFLEAMAAKLPVIATEVSAIPEIVQDHETGILVPPEDPKSLSEAMAELIDNPDQMKVMGEKGFDRLKDSFSVERMIKQHHELYKSLLED